MCTLAVYRGVSALYPLVVVANRDEFLGRPSSSPALRERDVFCGLDLVAGGTWLGCRVDGSGRIAGLLNRRPPALRAASGPGERSRGLLCSDALTAGAIEDVVAGLDADEAARYGGFNLFLADPERAVVVDNGDGVRRIPLDPGLSVLTNLDVNDPRCPRLAGASRRFDALLPLLAAGTEADRLVPAFAAVLSSHDDGGGPGAADPFARICVHMGDYGTRSSTMIFVDERGSVRWFHADGAPCGAPFVELPAAPRA